MNTRLFLVALATWSSFVVGCSTPAPSCDGGACTDSSAPPSRCLTAVLPQCDRGADPYSDEACFSLDDAESRSGATVDMARAPSVTAPTQAQALPGSTPFTFRWTAAMALLPRRTPARWNVATSPTTHAHEFNARAPSALEELARWTTLVPEAHAHCAPFSGVGYGLDFRAGGRVILRVEQSLTEYTPGAAAWEVLRSATGPIELRITAARFRNSVVSDGPFESPTRVTFTITP
ncbi:MAG: hypothetical protein U0269_00115 [Polyangiales bacterium]